VSTATPSLPSRGRVRSLFPTTQPICRNTPCSFGTCESEHSWGDGAHVAVVMLVRARGGASTFLRSQSAVLRDSILVRVCKYRAGSAHRVGGIRTSARRAVMSGVGGMAMVLWRVQCPPAFPQVGQESPVTWPWTMDSDCGLAGHSGTLDSLPFGR
jgi:hypothetical protein